MIDNAAVESLRAALGPGRSLAFFDLDGTMARGHMIFDFPDHLLEAGMFDPGKHAGIRTLQADFLAGRVTYRAAAEKLPALYALGIRGLNETAVALEAERFVECRMDYVFPYAKGLVRLMRESGRPALALSGSPAVTVKALARRLGMEAAIGTAAAVENGAFTGGVVQNLILTETKGVFFVLLSRELGLDDSRCFGFGDTEQDISFLSRVGHPVCLNPSAELRAEALKRRWPVFEDAQDVLAQVRKLVVRTDAV